MVLVRHEIPVGRLPPGQGRSSAGASMPSAAPPSTYESASQVRGSPFENQAGQAKDYRTARMQLVFLEQRNRQRLEFFASLAREKEANQSRSDPSAQPREGSVPQGYATQTRSLEGQNNKPLGTASVPGLEMGSPGSSQQDYYMRQKALEQQNQTRDYVSREGPWQHHSELLKRLQQHNVNRCKAIRAADPEAFDANQPGVRAELIRQVEGCSLQEKGTARTQTEYLSGQRLPGSPGTTCSPPVHTPQSASEYQAASSRPLPLRPARGPTNVDEDL
ncbi:uncharacterized protein L3040_008767 [Drepanopeziza brunnea f. sp. 'multigermtubi']|uniref:Uncharacterized protein n=1 Tax=Marssonina brunnea f. sp. multigermtubi (strain MB_m1) TaxID=1072389 RepID=K1X152_MARBU|nr:uncharacterized protein MBM_02969 [Drepanopeziza brunnea f. sp. 'multigermtubi' MB_m1]EKD18727.1 hypothetical protein MBM_02969 [Drepanopeziza brunnea f. sp. 'multigermtubi' MB_m1]KAJ5033655.1 hypothetical protein L3040_008767 [Drepanopeziza brunnea f. sp. 'multigermtubi']